MLNVECRMLTWWGCALSSAAFLESRCKESANENRAKLA